MRRALACAVLIGALLGLTSAVTTGTAAVTGARHIVVLPVTFTDASVQPYTLAQIAAVMSSDPTNVAGYFAASSDGQLTMTVDVRPYAALPDATAGCDFGTWLTDALAVNGDLSAYDHVILLFGYTSACSWAGLAYEPGVYSWINGQLHVQTIAHELGHNLGLGHANGPAGQTQGDGYTVMGYGATALLDGHEREELGWLTSTTIGEGAWSLVPLSSGSGRRVLTFPRGDGTSIEIDYRWTVPPYETGFNAGVILRIVDSSDATRIVDTAGQGFTYGYPLALGASWHDPVSGMWFTTTDRTSSGATILLSASAPSPPTTTTTTRPPVTTTTTRPPVTTTTRPKHKGSATR